MYVDTNVIVAFMDEADPNHERAVKLLKVKGSKKVSSFLTLVELASVYSRAGFNDPQALAIYSMEEAKVEVSEVGFGEVLKEAFRVADKIKLKTLDLLHVASCLLMGEKGFLTFDGDILKKRKELEELGIEVIGT